MKKSILLSIVTFGMIVAMTFSACGKKKTAKNVEEPIAGTDFVLVTTPDGAKGIKKGEMFVVEPKVKYDAINAVSGMFIATTENGQSLLDSETGYVLISGDTLIWKDPCFEGKRGNLFIVYMPAYKARFAADNYVAKGADALSVFNGKFAVWQKGQQIAESVGMYSKIAILPDGKLIVRKGKIWGIATVKDKTLVLGKLVSPRDLRKYKTMKGWSDDATLMILEQ